MTANELPIPGDPGYHPDTPNSPEADRPPTTPDSPAKDEIPGPDGEPGQDLPMEDKP